MTLHSCVPVHPAKAQTERAEPLCTDGPLKAGGVGALLLLQCHQSSFQSHSKGQFARGWAGWHGASKGAGVEESAEHSSVSGVALCSFSFCIVTTISNSPFDRLNTGKCQGFLTPPWFSVIQGVKMSRNEKGTRTVPAPFKVCDKGLPLLEVWDFSSPQQASSPAHNPDVSGGTWVPRK